MSEPEVCDFTIGNPHDIPPPGFVEALARKVAPQNDRWYAYKMNEPGRARSWPSPSKHGAG